MAKDGKKKLDGLLETYLSLGDNAGPIVRQLKKTNASTRSKLVAELRSLDTKRLELLDEIDNLEK